ncbi:MAG: TMEM175 family protein [Vicinamibacterales bacterium]
MTTTRVEAFSDGVIAILITIMVLDLKMPEGATSWDAIRESGLVLRLLTYVLSFVMLGIYWNNHHHMFHVTTHVNGRVLWANLHLLFWLSLVPFTTAWVGSSHNDKIPTAVYATVFLCAAQAWDILARQIVGMVANNAALMVLVTDARKGLISRLLYAAAIGAAFFYPAISDALIFAVALMWLVPNRRIERAAH